MRKPSIKSPHRFVFKRKWLIILRVDACKMHFLGADALLLENYHNKIVHKKGHEENRE